MSTPLEVAMVGVGGFGAYRRARMRESGLFRLVAAYDRDPATLAACAQEEGCVAAESFADLLATEGLEALIVSTGATYHAEQALAGMERGLHVFVEKPLCSTPAEVEALMAAQRRTGLVVGMGHDDHRHDPVAATIKSVIADGRLGRIACFEETTAHSGGLEIKPGEWRGDPDRNPGGMLFQCGVHALHELQYYFGPVRSVQCRMRADVHTTATADVAHVILDFASGVIGTLNAYHVTPYRHTLSIFGTAGAIHRNERSFDEGMTLQFQPRLANAKEALSSIPIDGTGDRCGNLKAFVEAIRSGTPHYTSLVDGARSVLAVFAADESARTGQAVAVAQV